MPAQAQPPAQGSVRPLYLPSNQISSKPWPNQAVERFPDTSLGSLALDLEIDAVEHPETAEMTTAIAQELRSRAVAGIRKQPPTANVESADDVSDAHWRPK